MKTSILIQNLKCGGCANTITNKLSTLNNVSGMEVNVEESKVSFDYLNEEDAFEVKDKLKNLGYPSIEVSNSFSSKAKSFVSCATGRLSL